MPWTPPPGGVDDEHTNKLGFGRGIRNWPNGGAKEELPQGRFAAGDVAAHALQWDPTPPDESVHWSTARNLMIEGGKQLPEKSRVYAGVRRTPCVAVMPHPGLHCC
jgi:hypothetical protein